jgi:protein-disulfide isomerase
MPQRKKRKSLTVGDILKKASAIKANQVMYFALLVAVFLIGYLVARVQLIESGTTTAPDTTAAAPNQPAQPGAPDPKDVLKKLTNGHFPVRGNSDAKVKIVEFADFRCPYCESFFTNTESQLMKDYVDTGKASFAFRQYEFLGDASVFAGNAAECANEQGKFWEMHDWLYQKQPPETDTSMYNVDDMTNAAQSLGMNADQFRNCLSAKKYDKNVSQDMTDGQAVGVSGTPTFYINGVQLVGAQPYSAFQSAIETALKN